ncbi:uncharacterized protein [Engystomops pustulosus]|uniref:uncharacterized protein isoform X2 n=1 Tax=Engystomops pustulosus TaxID=76066 RepID=UPI003AFAD174
MEPLVQRSARGKLGLVPLPYIFVVVLFPLWTAFSSHENSLLFSMCVIITVIVKGSLLSCWIVVRATSWLLQVMLVSCVLGAQIILLQSSLHASLFSLIFLVPPSTFSGICIFRLHLWKLGDDKKEDPVPRRNRRVIGIFSRSGQEEYAWLSSRLSRVGRVVPFTITNSNSQQFRQQVSECTAAILYHSKTRGRINIVNVTDSLYDEELQYMSGRLGKSNVIVVVDDVEDSSATKQRSILSGQPSIAQLTSGLYLFTTQEKSQEKLLTEKVQTMYKIIPEGWSSCSLVSDVILVFLVIAPWFYFIHSAYHLIFLITTNLTGSFLVYHDIYDLNHSDCELPSTYPIALKKSPHHLQKKGAHMVGLVPVLVLMVLELSFLYWVESVIRMVLLIGQSLGTGAFILKISTS